MRKLMYSLGLKKEWDASSTADKASTWDVRITKLLKTRWINSCDAQNKKNTKLGLYNSLGGHFGLKHYLEIPDIHCRDILARLRAGSHSLRIDQGRFANLYRHERTCLICRLEVEDVAHYTLRCPGFTKIRGGFFRKMSRYLSLDGNEELRLKWSENKLRVVLGFEGDLKSMSLSCVFLKKLRKKKIKDAWH